ncbi:hypothetical protein [Vibrio genomosp. F10]|uniref:hypothetical protein n=1 Tax=Vibrio genomosp. F10 TaxID=723171 RepID=UPI001301076A|nr:hypothetical protein [Vibrio genomosp. F10]
MRIKHYKSDNPAASLMDVLLLTLIDSRLPFYRVINNEGYIWTPIEIPFEDFMKQSLFVKVSLETRASFEMTNFLGIAEHA